MSVRRAFLAVPLVFLLVAAMSAPAFGNYLNYPINIDGGIRAETEVVAHGNHYGPHDYSPYHSGDGYGYDISSNGYDAYRDSYVTMTMTNGNLASTDSVYSYGSSSMSGLNENKEQISGAGLDAQLDVWVDEDPNAQAGEATIVMDVWGLGERMNTISQAWATVTGTVGAPQNPMNQNLTVLSGGGHSSVLLEIIVTAPNSDSWELQIGDQVFESYMMSDPYNFSVEVPITVGLPTHFAFEYQDEFHISDIGLPEYYGNQGVVQMYVKEVPEPATLSLTALTGLALLRRRR